MGSSGCIEECGLRGCAEVVFAANDVVPLPGEPDLDEALLALAAQPVAP